MMLKAKIKHLLLVLKLRKRRRATERLIKLWEQIKGDKRLPAAAEFDVSLFIGDIFPNCFMIEVDNRRSRDYKYRHGYFGESIANSFQHDIIAIEILTHLVSPFSDEQVKKFDQVRTRLQPVVDDDEFVNSNGDRILYRQCLVPLAGPSGDLGFILGVMNWKVEQKGSHAAKVRKRRS